MNRGFNASHVARKSLHERLFNFNHTFGTGAGKLKWILKKDRKIVGSMRWSPDSRYLVYGDDDGGTDPSGWLVSFIAGGPITGRVFIYRLEDGVEVFFRDLARGLTEQDQWISTKARK